MIDPGILDAATGAGSFGLTFVASTLHNVLKLRSREREADKIRAHDVTLTAMGNSYNDVQRARNAIPEMDKTGSKGSFTGWTRRIIGLTVISLLFFVGFSMHGVSLPIVVQHHIFGIGWTTHIVQHLPHMAWLPCFPQLLFAVVFGYYGKMPAV